MGNYFEGKYFDVFEWTNVIESTRMFLCMIKENIFEKKHCMFA